MMEASREGCCSHHWGDVACIISGDHACNISQNSGRSIFLLKSPDIPLDNTLLPFYAARSEYFTRRAAQFIPQEESSDDDSLFGGQRWHVMDTAIISKNYQVRIPQRIRKAMRLAPGQKVQVLLYDNRIELIPEHDIRTMRGFLKGINTAFERDEDRLEYP